MRWGNRVSYLVLALTCVVGGARADAAVPVFEEHPATGWVVDDGVVYSMAHLDGTLVVGGSFSQVRNPTTGQVVRRTNLAAFDEDTGALLNTFAQGANDTVRALETDGTVVYAGGAFSSIGGLSRQRLAALDSTGRALSTFNARASNNVFSLEHHAGTLYLGGWFGSVNGVRHPRIAAVDGTTGALRAGFTASADRTVFALMVIPGTDRLVAGGNFTNLSGAGRQFLGSVSTTSGAATSWRPPADCGSCYVFDLATRDDLVYGAVAGPGGRASAWSTVTGARRWSQWGDGDVQAVAVVGDTLYAGGHYDPRFGTENGVAATRQQIAAMDAATGTLLPWNPSVTGPYGVWDIAADEDSLWLSGGFSRVNGTRAHERLARFPVSSAVPLPTFVEPGSTWRYLDTGADLGTGWRGPGYSDSSWSQGPAQLGFGDGDEATAMTRGHLTYYFRRGFEVSDTSAVDSLELRFLRDDGLVAYLNGTEVARSNMPSGTVTAQTTAVQVMAGQDERRWHSVPVPASLLRTGTNVLSVEVHQSSLGSSDVSFDAALAAR